MMYSGLPPRLRRIVKAVLAAAWVFAGLAGASAAFLPTSPALLELGPFWSYTSGTALFVSALVAAVGAATARYRWEWVAAWGAAASLVPYTMTLWGLVFSVSPDRLTAAFLATSLVTFFVLRALLCAAHAAKLREVHKAGTAAVEIAQSEGEEDAGDAPVGG